MRQAEGALSRLRRRGVGRRREWFAGAMGGRTVRRCALTLCLVVAALPVLPVSPTADSTPAPPASSRHGTTDAGAALSLQAELQRARDQLAALQAAPDGADELPTAQLRAANRLVALLSARVEALVLRPETTASPQPLALAGSPPYATVDVDRLRDQLDSLESQRAALRPLLAGLLTSRQDAAAGLRKAAETLRLRRELAERARGEPALARTRADLELATIEHRVAELELERIDSAIQTAQARLDALAGPAAQLSARLETARAQQNIADDHLAAVRREAEARRGAIAAERDRLEAALQQPRLAGALPDSAARRETRWSRDALASLAELDAVVAARDAVWQQRRAALAAAGSDAGRATVAAELRRSLDQARAHERAIGERLALLRSELRLQRARLDAAADDPARRTAETRALDRLQARADIDDDLQHELARMAVLLERSLDDMALERAPPSSRDLLARAHLWAATLLTAVWQYELFSASETLIVDGRPVAVDYGVTVGKSIGVVLLFGAGWWLAARLGRALIAAVVRRRVIGEALGRVLYRWLMTALLLVVLWGVLKLARVPLTAFAFLGGALAIGIGFGAQNLLKNLMSGLIILFERKIRVGDVVTVGGVSGTVTAVDLRATTVRAFDGIHSILPNSYLLENLVGDWSQGAGGLRTELRVSAAYGTDSAAAAGLILDCARAHPQVLADPAPQVLLDDFATHGLVFKLWIWTKLGGARAGPLVASDLRFAIDRAFAAHGIEPPLWRHVVGSTAERAA